MEYDFGFPYAILTEQEQDDALWNRTTILDAQYDIATGFNWGKTEEGFKFWSDICKRLERILCEGN